MTHVAISPSEFSSATAEEAHYDLGDRCVTPPEPTDATAEPADETPAKDEQPERTHKPVSWWLRLYAAIIWESLRNPFSTSYIDMSTGKVIQAPNLNGRTKAS